jgi:hypothetical protein
VYDVLQIITENGRSPASVHRQTFIFPWLLKCFLQTSHENGQYSTQVHRRHFKLCCVLNDFLHLKMDAPHDKCADDQPRGLPLQKISYIYHIFLLLGLCSLIFRLPWLEVSPCFHMVIHVFLFFRFMYSYCLTTPTEVFLCFNTVIYVFLFLGQCILIVPLPWLRFINALIL